MTRTPRLFAKDGQRSIRWTRRAEQHLQKPDKEAVTTHYRHGQQWKKNDNQKKEQAGFFARLLGSVIR
jgi:hypothetical protein